MSIQNRKKDHVQLTVHEDVFYQKKTGFERFDFVHNALPEVDFNEVNLSATLLGRSFSFPLFISSMTGGYSDAGAVNAQIAAFCEKQNLPFGVGSQRAMLEDPAQLESFSIVRKYAPTAFISANIGGSQLIGGLSEKKIRILIEAIEADAITVHLNPLQELMQPEGDNQFRGIKDGIGRLISLSDCPVIVKETGAGISKKTADILLEMGAAVIDVSGAGGTSWAKVENLRKKRDHPMAMFDEWGIPAADCIIGVNELRQSRQLELIGSGGIRSSADMVKAIALGADFTAMAQPVIQALFSGGIEALELRFEQWTKEASIMLTLLGCRSFSELNRSHLRQVK